MILTSELKKGRYGLGERTGTANYSKSWLIVLRGDLEKPMVCAFLERTLAVISLHLSAKSASAAPDCT
jgi:hypothetical protein